MERISSTDLGLEFTTPEALPFPVMARKLRRNRRLTHFQVFGERNSGTNFVSNLIDRNTQLDMVGSYGWKHGFPVAVGFHPQALIVFVFRDPFDWLVSMYNRPYAASRTIDFSSFSTFLRSPWSSFLRGNSYENWTKNWNATIVEGLDGRKCALDRHPITGLRFRDPIELRICKLFGGLSLANRDCNFIAASYEDVSLHREAFVDYVREFAGVVRTDRFDPVLQKVSPTNATKRNFRRGDISSEDMAFIHANLDLELETMLGYGNALSQQPA